MDTSADGRASDQSDTTADGDDTPDTADIMDTSDTANIIDADVFEIITQTDGRTFLDSGSMALNDEQIPSESAESDLPPENLSNPDEARVPDARAQVPVVTVNFLLGNPGAPIDGMHGSSAYESRQGSLGGSVWAPFQSECDWRVAHWAKVNGISSSAITELLAIPEVRPPFSFFPFALLNGV
jgi:hypothetical protein